jgi:hypothetical protein
MKYKRDKHQSDETLNVRRVVKSQMPYRGRIMLKMSQFVGLFTRAFEVMDLRL